MIAYYRDKIHYKHQEQKIILILVCLLLSVSSFAQSHLTFMGIPIDGNINSFAQKLSAKGIKVSSKNKTMNLPNARVFEGIWSKQNAAIIVEYFGSKKIVCNVKVMINSYNKDALELFQSDVEFDIMKKYDDRFHYETTTRIGNQEITIYHIHKSVSNDEKIGAISTYIDDESDQSILYIIYKDEHNTKLKCSEPNDDI